MDSILVIGLKVWGFVQLALNYGLLDMLGWSISDIHDPVSRLKNNIIDERIVHSVADFLSSS
jgi:hypothetical protein